MSAEYITIKQGSASVTVLGNPAPSVPREFITAAAFWDRFTNAEMIDYDVAMQHDPGATNAAKRLAARLRIFRRELSDTGKVRLSKPKTTDFVTSLEAAGVIAAGRAAAILTAPVSADELAQ